MTRAVCLLLLVVAVRVAVAAAPAVSFTRDVGPILHQKCEACHNAEKAKGEYRLDTFERLTTPGAGKKAPVVAGGGGELLRRLTIAADDDEHMPQKADPLPAEQVALIARWVEQGARFDGADPRAPLASQISPDPVADAPQVYRRPVPITALAFAPGGGVLAAGGYHEVTLWDPADGRLLGRIPRLPQRIYGLDFSPDGRTLAVAGGAPGAAGLVQLCDVAKREARPPLVRIGDVMLVARFSPDGTRVAAGGADNAVRIFDAATGARTHLIEQHADWVTDLAFSPDGAWLVTASRDKSARVFDARTGTMRSAFLGHAQPVSVVSFNGKGETVFSAARGDGKVRAWLAAEGKETSTIDAGEADVSRLLVIPGGFVMTSGGGAVRRYAFEKKAFDAPWPAGGRPVYALAYDAKGRRVAAGDQAGVVRVCDVEQGAKAAEFVAAPGYKPAP